jgi:hypothetical protein
MPSGAAKKGLWDDLQRPERTTDELVADAEWAISLCKQAFAQTAAWQAQQEREAPQRLVEQARRHAIARAEVDAKYRAIFAKQGVTLNGFLAGSTLRKDAVPLPDGISFLQRGPTENV